jgi:hypothetical protein
MIKNFTYKRHVRTTRPDLNLFKVICGQKLITICRSEEKAIEMCENLNNDFWFLDRGQTRKDRWG